MSREENNLTIKAQHHFEKNQNVSSIAIVTGEDGFDKIHIQLPSNAPLLGRLQTMPSQLQIHGLVVFRENKNGGVVLKISHGVGSVAKSIDFADTRQVISRLMNDGLVTQLEATSARATLENSLTQSQGAEIKR